MAKISKILNKLLATEKTTGMRESQNKYVFEVHGSASQGSVANEVSKHYKVDVENVNLMNVPGKKRRLNRTNVFVRTPKWKKAIVELKTGQKIDEAKKDKEEKKEETK